MAKQNSKSSAAWLFVLHINFVTWKCQQALTICDADWCNPGYEPEPGFFSALTGYNIVEGSPLVFSGLTDPGFETSYIFQGTLFDPATTRYRKHPGITIRKSLACSTVSKSETITSARAYRDFLATKSAIGLGISVDYSRRVQSAFTRSMTQPQSSISGAFAGSDSYRQNVKFFTKEHGVVTIKHATCALYTVKVDLFNPPPFTVSFEKALESLHRVTNAREEEKNKKFKLFIDNFGTHFIDQATLGAGLVLIRRYRRSEYQTVTQTAIEECNAGSFSARFFGIGGSAAAEKCKKVQSDTYSKIEGSYEREYSSSYGSKPADTFEEWKSQDFTSPVVIKMQLSPILNLFDDRYMKAYEERIDYKSILRWLAPKYINYCEMFKYELGVESCDAESKKQCGWNDNCDARTQQCVNDDTSANGHVCCRLGCLSSPCTDLEICIDEANCGFRCYTPPGPPGPSRPPKPNGAQRVCVTSLLGFLFLTLLSLGLSI